jgi:hypothetical protein
MGQARVVATGCRPMFEQYMSHNKKLLYSRAVTSRSNLLRFAALASIVGLGLLPVGCGSGSNSSGSSGTTGAAVTTENGPEASAKFLNKADRSIVKFGKEASAAEREAASAVLTENLEAREAGDFATQCATLTTTAIEEIPGAKKSGSLEDHCTAALKELATPLSQSAKARKNTLSGPITAMRVKGNVAHALYHGNDGKDYAMGLEKEDGAWKVGSIETIEL